VAVRVRLLRARRKLAAVLRPEQDAKPAEHEDVRNGMRKNQQGRPANNLKAAA
jgi:hypothetical protein